MPKVGGKKFAYTAKGKAAAKSYAKKIRSGGGERIGATPSRGAPRQKQSTGGKVRRGKK